MFIKTELSGVRLLINLDNVVCIWEKSGGKCQVYYVNGEYDDIQMSFDEMEKLLSQLEKMMK